MQDHVRIGDKRSHEHEEPGGDPEHCRDRSSFNGGKSHGAGRLTTPGEQLTEEEPKEETEKQKLYSDSNCYSGGHKGVFTIYRG